MSEMLSIDLDPTPGNQDRLQFAAGVSPDDIRVSLPPGTSATTVTIADLVLTIPGGSGAPSGGIIRIQEAFAVSGPGMGRIERIEFADAPQLVGA